MGGASIAMIRNCEPHWRDGGEVWGRQDQCDQFRCHKLILISSDKRRMVQYSQ